jgi:hypothetical protein
MCFLWGTNWISYLRRRHSLNLKSVHRSNADYVYFPRGKGVQREMGKQRHDRWQELDRHKKQDLSLSSSTGIISSATGSQPSLPLETADHPTSRSRQLPSYPSSAKFPHFLRDGRLMLSSDPSFCPLTAFELAHEFLLCEAWNKHHSTRGHLILAPTCNFLS